MRLCVLPFADLSVRKVNSHQRTNVCSVEETGEPAVEQDDEGLVLRARSGDQAAARALFDRYRELAYRIAYHQLGRGEEALDVVQEAFIKAFSGLARLRDPARFQAWFLRIVTNQARDFGRQVRRRDRLGLLAPGTAARGDEDAAEAAPQAMDTRTPGEQAEASELAEGLRLGLADLDEDHRQALLLVSQGGLSYREVAEVLGIPIGTVMSRLHYARRSLRDWLQKRGYL
jgi:RNA polymerase sigma-70 factor (ECF subfamily)